MAGLPWARLDSMIFTHDKISELLDDEDGADAFVTYIFSLAFSVGNGTDGLVKRSDLRLLRGNVPLAQSLVRHGLWDDAGVNKWSIHNFSDRQMLNAVAERMQEAARIGGIKSGETRRKQRDNEGTL